MLTLLAAYDLHLYQTCNSGIRLHSPLVRYACDELFEDRKMLEVEYDASLCTHCFDQWLFEIGSVRGVNILSETEVRNDVHSSAAIGIEKIHGVFQSCYVGRKLRKELWSGSL